MFTGFRLKYPEYEVITPQTKKIFTVRSLNVEEEEKLKGSFLSPIKMSEHLNKCIFETIASKPDEIRDYTSFLTTTTLKDRDALLYGLYHITYEEIRNYEVRCSGCKKEYLVTAKASDMFNFLAYPGDDVLTNKTEVPLQISQGVTAFIRQPSLDDEQEAIKRYAGLPGVTVEMIVETLIIDRFEQDVENSTVPFSVTERQDIISAYRTLPARDKRVIYEKYNEVFGKYGIELKLKTFCQHCGVEETINVDLVENFFRMVYTS